jgi:hypothetical protein
MPRPLPGEQPPIPPHYKILLEHKISSFSASILGSCIGHLMDRGLNDDEILTVVVEFCKQIRAAVKDPRTMPNLIAQAEILKDAADNDE